ncbi:MAG: polyprenol monophosphomannose synthase [Planctomycetota bacterium]
MSILISLCTYNECRNIAELIPQLLETVPTASVLVVDDNSPAGTGRLADELATADSRIQVLHRPARLGLGTATTAAFEFAVRRGFTQLVNLDADFSHNPRYVPQLLDAMQHCDVAIASRYAPGGGVTGWTFRRRLMSLLINWWARLLLGLKTRDNSGSFRCYNVSLLARVDWSKAQATGYAIQEEILFRCLQAGGRLREIPYFFEDRRHGITKINLRECVRAVWVILRMGLQRFGTSRHSG